jgi:hypothetical protein
LIAAWHAEDSIAVLTEGKSHVVAPVKKFQGGCNLEYVQMRFFPVDDDDA